MQHSQKNRTLSRTRRGRSALLRSLAISLIRDGQIKTTTAKAKELRPFIEKIITYSMKDDQSTRKVISSRLGEPNKIILDKLFIEIAPQYNERAGGYTRIIKLGQITPGKDESIIEFVV